MHRIIIKTYLILIVSVVLSWMGGPALVHSDEAAKGKAVEGPPMPVVLEHKGRAAELDRPRVFFDHDRHTRALKQKKAEDCTVCHVLKEKDQRLTNPEVGVFRFPKAVHNASDKTSIMYAYHDQCTTCHNKMTAEAKTSGPPIGLCGKCHSRRPAVKEAQWPQTPIFDYGRHAKHAESIGKMGNPDALNVVRNIQVLGEVEPARKTCLICHHGYDAKTKKVTYKKDSENSCRACHKAQDEANARSIKQAAHAACIGCHMQVALQDKRNPAAQAPLKSGPFECRGCHGIRKEPTPDEIAKFPRLVRGQKDVIDLTFPAADDKPVKPEVQTVSTSRMKVVPFNHKSHEPRAKFCNTCHHHSLEKCSNCHTVPGDPKKGGVSFERAFHKPGASQACVGCHQSAKADKKCAGCHQWMNGEMPKSSCTVCHRGPSEGRIAEVPPMPLTWDKEKVPEKVQIKGMEKEFKPAELPHQKILNKLVTISNESSLARWFHAVKDQTLCAGCHHHGEPHASNKLPACSACHNRPFDPKALGRPGLMGAYHRQCIGCHTAMKHKPAALECVKCHAAKEGVHTAGLIAPIPGTGK